MAFVAVAAAGKRELVLRRDSLGEEEAEAVESGRDESLYTIVTLNHLQVSGFAGLKTLSPKVSQLGGLLQLILTHNGLQSLPDEIDALSKLKLLDVSQNQLKGLPQSLYCLSSLQTLLLGSNCLTDACFPTLPETDGLFPSLHHVDLTHNKLTELPSFVYSSGNISELLASDNDIALLQPSLGALSNLKQLEMKRNKLTLLPYEITSCAKLKSIGFEDNPMHDRRLMKLIAQHGERKPKAVLDYIASHAPKPKAVGGRKKGGKKKAGHDQEASRSVQQEDSDSDVEFVDTKPDVLVVRPAQFVEVYAQAEARQVRPYLVCAVLRGVDLARGEAYKEFIALQSKLHDTVCKRRRVATIATHDLSKLSPPLTYACGPSDAITFSPLGWSSQLTAQKFLDHVKDNKPEKGGGGKRVKQPDPAAAAISKYLSFVNPSAMVYVQDSTGIVVSLPPLTNCEPTKIDSTSSDLFLEVTSGENLASCKAVMDTLIEGMCWGGIVGADGVLGVEQVRVVDHAGHLLVLYPSRTDLTSGKVNVRRP